MPKNFSHRKNFHIEFISFFTPSALLSIIAITKLFFGLDALINFWYYSYPKRHVLLILPIFCLLKDALDNRCDPAQGNTTVKDHN